jgi:hypothetical protein
MRKTLWDTFRKLIVTTCDIVEILVKLFVSNRIFCFLKIVTLTKGLYFSFFYEWVHHMFTEINSWGKMSVDVVIKHLNMGLYCLYLNIFIVTTA